MGKAGNNVLISHVEGMWNHWRQLSINVNHGSCWPAPLHDRMHCQIVNEVFCGKGLGHGVWLWDML